MAEFTTEKRREFTSSNSQLADAQTTVVVNEQLDNTYANKISEDTTNNGIFRTTNSELTGMAYEYRFLVGKYHPTLDEEEYKYNYFEESGVATERSYWDNEELQKAGRLESGNEFHLNIREGTTVKYPIRPEKYESWTDDLSDFVSDFETTEQKLIAMVRTLDGWYTSGGGTGNLETSLFGNYSELVLGALDDNQPYMTVGYADYQSDPNGDYMLPGFDANGELILINGGDLVNFAFGMVVSSRDLPSRILFAPYGKVGDIPEDSAVTSTFDTGTQIIQLISEQVIFTLKGYYEKTKHYLDNNPDYAGVSNAAIIVTIDNVLSLIEAWEALGNSTDFSTMLQLMTDIELERTALVISDRVAYIGSYLSGATTLYSDRFDIIDLRLTKNMGTLKEIMSAKKGIEVVDVIFSDRDDTETVHNKYFIVKKSLLNGDFYMRIFTDNADGLSIGDNCYILTDDESLPEIESLITDIVDGRVQDYVNTIYHEDGTSIPVYVDCKKIFFGSNIFSDEYLETDNFRIIKEI